MVSTLPSTAAEFARQGSGLPVPSTVIETRLWLDEHEWLHTLLKSPRNVAPTFRFPDLISACVSLVFAASDAAQIVFAYLNTELAMRPSDGPRRKETMWRTQYELLLNLQRSPANRHPNPNYQLDALTTACVALACHADPTGAAVLKQARLNMVERANQRRSVLATHTATDRSDT
jgi:hypothetical protein